MSSQIPSWYYQAQNLAHRILKARLYPPKGYLRISSTPHCGSGGEEDGGGWGQGGLVTGGGRRSGGWGRYGLMTGGLVTNCGQGGGCWAHAELTNSEGGQGVVSTASLGAFSILSTSSTLDSNCSSWTLAELGGLGGLGESSRVKVGCPVLTNEAIRKRCQRHE